jgi:hypothetical protein
MASLSSPRPSGADGSTVLLRFTWYFDVINLGKGIVLIQFHHFEIQTIIMYFELAKVEKAQSGAIELVGEFSFSLVNCELVSRSSTAA